MITPHTEIIVRTGGAEVLRKSVPPGDYVIGRAAGCDVQVEAGQVAPRHAQLTINYDHAFIDDLGSGSGTFVNGQRVTASTRLWPNQRIQLGNATVTLRRKRAADDSDESLAPQVAAVRQLLPDELLHDAKYEIGDQIAQGGMGAILNAKEVAIRREVAMKVMLTSGEHEDLRRFVEEAQITGQLEHPNIVPVHELNVDENDQVFYTMKLVRGVTLRKVLELLAAGDEAAVERYPLSALLTIFQKVCDALAFAHSRGVIHRDLKPENIMLGDYGEVLVMDWGLAKTLGGRRSVGAPSSPESVGADKAAPSSVDDPAAPSQTLAGTIMGTPQYMAPEQARGDIEALDARSDIYALGAILYHALTLCPPIDATTIDDILAKVRAGEVIPPIERQPPPRPRRAPASADNLPAPLTPIDLNAPTILQTQAEQPVVGQAPRLPPTPRSAGGAPALHHLPDGRVPDSLNAVVLKAMALEQAARYQHVAELQADLTAYQNGFATRAENAGLGKQLVLLVKRHRGAFATAAAAWFIITALAVWFVINITRERNRATANEQKATRNAEIAAANAREAKQNAEVAQTNEKRAVASEQEAVAEKENVRRALAKSALALAEAAYREADGPAMQSALDQVPADLRDANWSYLLEQSDTSIARVTTGSGAIRGVAAHPKLAGVFAIIDDRRNITILEARTGVRLLQFSSDPGKPSTYFQLAFTSDGERIAVGKSASPNDPGDGITIYNARDGTKLLSLDSGPVSKLEFGPDARHLLQVSRAAKIALWDASTGKLVWEKLSAVSDLRAGFLPSGEQVLAKAQSRKLDLFNLGDGSVSRTFDSARNAGAFAIRPDGHAVALGSLDGTVNSIDLRDGSLLFSVRAHLAPVSDAIYTPDGERLVSVALLGDGRHSIVVSSAGTGAPLQTLIGGRGDLRGIALHPVSGELLVRGEQSRLWDVAGTAPKWSLATGPQTGTSTAGAAFLGDDLFLGPSKTHRTSLIDLRTQSVLWSPSNAGLGKPTLSADARFIALAILGRSNGAGRIHLVKNDQGALSVAGQSPRGYFEFTGGLEALRLSPAGDRLAMVTTGTARQFAIVHPATGAPLISIEQKRFHSIRDLQWISSATQLIGIAIANKPRGVDQSEERIIVWDAATGQQVRSVVHPTALDCLVVAPDGKSFAAAGADKLVHVFDTETLAERQAFRAHDGPITALAWHPARPIVATGSADLTIKLWHLESGRRLETLRGPTAAPRVLNFSPSGQRLACASEDRMVRIWEPKPLNNAVLDAPRHRRLGGPARQAHDRRGKGERQRLDAQRRGAGEPQ